jgi:transcriptional regulator GlxA family with amidase domain
MTLMNTWLGWQIRNRETWLLNIGIYIYNNAEVLDFSGPFEVFATASRLSNPANLFHVSLIAETNQPVIARGNFQITPHHTIDAHPVLDVLIVSGGVHQLELSKPAVTEWIARTADTASTVASVCTGAFLLAEAGLLAGLDVTTHWEDAQDLQASYPNLNVLTAQRWVDAGKFVTSGGISAGIDMSLYLVSKLGNRELAEKTARQMEYNWTQS